MSKPGINAIILKKSRSKHVIVIQLLLIPYYWFASGADAIAQANAVQHDPAGYLLRLAENPNMTHSTEARAALRSVANTHSVDYDTQVSRRPVHAVRAGAIASRQLASDLKTYLAKQKVQQAAGVFSATAVEHDPVWDTIDAKVNSSHKSIMAGFAEQEAILANSVDIDKQKSQQTAQQRYLDKHILLKNKLSQARLERGEARNQLLQDIVSQLETTHDQRPMQSVNPKALPFASAKHDVRKPRLSGELFNSSPTNPETATNSEPTHSKARFTTSSEFAFSLQATSPLPEDLQSNIDVQITPEISALAANLDNNPLAIYDWVYNSIDFYPTTGVVQGSQLTLDMQRGNAYDITTLFVALLRAAGVPTRFVEGTIEVPVAQVMNWVGNPATPEIAQQILGSGGIPNVAIVNGSGEILSFRIEHVWVEAWLDYVPSRGAVQITGDTWVPFDPAFKQFSYVAPTTLLNDVPIDNVLNSAGTFFTVDETAGRITNVDDDALDTPMEQWTNQLMDQIEAGPVPLIQLTVEDILGSRSINEAQTNIAAGSLPYQILAKGSPVATLPSSARHSVTVRGYRSSFDRTIGSSDLSVTLSLAELNMQRLNVHFEPASTADADVLEAARSTGASSLPIASVNVIPQLKLDNNVLAVGLSRNMGSDYFLDIQITGPTGATTIDYNIISGDEAVIGITGNGFTKSALEKRLASNPVDNTPEYLHQVNLHYWAESDLLNSRAAVGLNGYITRLPSVGLFSSPLTVSYLFGQPNTGVYASRFMDVKRSFIGAAADTPSNRVSLVKQAGFNGSYLEGTTFDQLNDTTDPIIRGVDSMKLLSAAAQQNIPLYRITPANRNVAVPALNLPSGVIANINAALDQGQTVLTPESTVNTGPYSGVGYILQDETTGEGAYLIDGGLNGGGIFDCLEELVPKLVTVLAVVIAVILAVIMIWLLAAALAPILAGIGAIASQAWAAFLLMLRSLAPLSLALA